MYWFVPKWGIPVKWPFRRSNYNELWDLGVSLFSYKLFLNFGSSVWVHKAIALDDIIWARLLLWTARRTLHQVWLSVYWGDNCLLAAMCSGSLRVFSLLHRTSRLRWAARLKPLMKKMDLLWTLDKVKKSSRCNSSHGRSAFTWKYFFFHNPQWLFGTQRIQCSYLIFRVFNSNSYFFFVFNCFLSVRSWVWLVLFFKCVLDDSTQWTWMKHGWIME